MGWISDPLHVEWKTTPEVPGLRLLHDTFHTLTWETSGRGWLRRLFEDGTEQYTLDTLDLPRVFIERNVGVKSRRKRWFIVSRRPPEKWRQAKYPPKLSGPYPTLESAQAAYRILHAAGQLT